MKEIKFKGKRKHGEEILTGDLNHINGVVYIFPRGTDTPLNSPDWFEVDDDSVTASGDLGELINELINKNEELTIALEQAMNQIHNLKHPF